MIWTDSSGVVARYSGDVSTLSNLPHGSGVAQLDNDHIFDGNWVEGTKSGYGTYTWPSGARYDGDFKDSMFHGRGAFCWSDGERYVGAFEHGKIHGFGVYNWPDGRSYTGMYSNGKRHGQGVMKDGGENVLHDGNWKDGFPVG